MGTEPHLPQWAALSVDVNAVEYGKMTTRQQSIDATLKAIQEKTEKDSCRRQNRKTAATKTKNRATTY
jgi:hypothetical protein